MADDALSRRSLLLSGAGAAAALALAPARSLAAAVGMGAAAGTIELGALAQGELRRVALPPDVAVAGLQWSGGAGGASPRLRVRLPAGSWGPWASAGAAGHGPDAAAGALPCGGEPLWVGAARDVEIRSAGDLGGVRLRYVLGASARGARAGAAALSLAQPILAAGPGQPPIIARSAWAKGVQLPRVAPEYGRIELAFVHHTENPNGYSAAQVPAMLRAIFVFHRDVNGWNDIGYNFVVDLSGRVFEARAGGIDEPVVGAHAGGYNLVSTGVAVLGSFTGTPISPAARKTLERLIAWKLALHGTPSQGRVVVRVNRAGAVYSKYPAGARVSLPRIAGHRDADSTDCPGDALYAQLPYVRRGVAPLAPRPLVLSLALQPPGAPAEAVPTGPSLLATLALLDGTPVAGAAIVLQSRTVTRRGTIVNETTVAEGVTDGEGRLVLPATFAAAAGAPLWVRALHPGGAGSSAAVSPAVLVDPLSAAAPGASAPTG